MWCFVFLATGLSATRVTQIKYLLVDYSDKKCVISWTGHFLMIYSGTCQSYLIVGTATFTQIDYAEEAEEVIFRRNLKSGGVIVSKTETPQHKITLLESEKRGENSRAGYYNLVEFTEFWNSILIHWNPCPILNIIAARCPNPILNCPHGDYQRSAIQSAHVLCVLYPFISTSLWHFWRL